MKTLVRPHRAACAALRCTVQLATPGRQRAQPPAIFLRADGSAAAAPPYAMRGLREAGSAFPGKP